MLVKLFNSVEAKSPISIFPKLQDPCKDQASLCIMIWAKLEKLFNSVEAKSPITICSIMQDPCKDQSSLCVIILGAGEAV